MNRNPMRFNQMAQLVLVLSIIANLLVSSWPNLSFSATAIFQEPAVPTDKSASTALSYPSSKKD